MRAKMQHHRGDAAAYVGDWLADHPSRRSLETLQRTLTRTTEALAIGLGRPGGKAPEWSAAEWAVARAVAAIHGVSPLLARTLRWRGPESWHRFLEAQTVHTAQRFVRIRDLLQLIDERAREAGIPVVPLKGAALHTLGVYAPGERPMADVDLLVREEHSLRFAELLAALGFSETLRTWKNRVFACDDDPEAAALGEHVDNGVKVELHCRVAEALPRPALDVTAIVFPETPRPGFNGYASKAALLLHMLLHTAGNLVSRGVRLLQLHDIAQLAAVTSAADWQELSREAARTADGSLWWAFPPLALANRYYGCVPEGVLKETAADCHWVLKRLYRRRTLAEASLSNLWNRPFSGIEWARSPSVLLAYTAARVVPDREALQLREVLAKVQPRVYGGTWGHLSQRQRMVRWMLSRQPQRATLQPVRAALLATFE